MILAHRFVKAVFVLLLLVSLLHFAVQSFSGWQHGYDENTLNDMSIFVDAGKRFLASGELYQRSGDYGTVYAPDRPVYKFPPAYQLTILPWLRAGVADSAFLHFQHAIYLLLYLASVLLLTRHCLPPANSALRWLLVAIACWFAPFAEAYLNLHAEVLVLFLLVLALAFTNHKPFAAGFTIAIATSIKIYPVFALLHFLLQRQWKVIVGFTAGLFVTQAIVIAAIGTTETMFYVGNILPVLLREHPVNHSQNLMIEKLLVDHQWIAQMNDHIHLALKMLCLSWLVVLAVQDRQATVQSRTLGFAMTVSLTLIWLTNYWLQYQLLLMIPLAVLIGEVSRLQKRFFTIGVYGLAFILCIHDTWSDTLDIFVTLEFQKLVLVSYLQAHGLIATLVHSLPLSYTLAPGYLLSLMLHVLDSLKILAPYAAFLLCGYAMKQAQHPRQASRE